MAYAPAHRWRVLTEATWRDRQGLARNDPPSVRPNTANDELSRGPGSPLPPSLFAHCGQEMSLPYTVDPGAGTGDRHPMGLDVKLLLVGCAGSRQWPRRRGWAF